MLESIHILTFSFFLCFTPRLEFCGWLTDFIPPQVRLLPFILVITLAITAGLQQIFCIHWLTSGLLKAVVVCVI